MSIQVQIKVNADKVAEAFRKAPRALGKNLSIAVVKSGFLVERESKIVTPVITGLLRMSIGTEIQPLSAVIFPRTEYAKFVHEGTRFQKAQPFMEWGVQKAQDRIESFFEKAVDNTLSGIARSA